VNPRVTEQNVLPRIKEFFLSINLAVLCKFRTLKFFYLQFLGFLIYFYFLDCAWSKPHETNPQIIWDYCIFHFGFSNFLWMHVSMRQIIINKLIARINKSLSKTRYTGINRGSLITGTSVTIHILKDYLRHTTISNKIFKNKAILWIVMTTKSSLIT
jgi:hypothetical protein